jgi:hypothetical protein
MKYDLTEKKAWITPGIEEASVQTTAAKLYESPSEFFSFLFLGGGDPPAPEGGDDQPGGPS